MSNNLTEDEIFTAYREYRAVAGHKDTNDAVIAFNLYVFGHKTKRHSDPATYQDESMTEKQIKRVRLLLSPHSKALYQAWRVQHGQHDDIKTEV